jgi:hypothetical protein
MRGSGGGRSTAGAGAGIDSGGEAGWGGAGFAAGGGDTSEAPLVAAGASTAGACANEGAGAIGVFVDAAPSRDPGGVMPPLRARGVV